MRTIKEILNHPETKKRKSDWLVGNLILNNTINILAGGPACGKTTFIINMVKSILDEETFLDRKTKKVNKVLYVSTEISDEDIAIRFDKLGLKNTESVFIISNETFGQFYLEEKVRDFDLIIIDVLVDFFDSYCKDNNDYTEIYNVFNEIRRNSTLNKKTWIFLHHLNKKDQILGSTALNAATDTRMILKMPNGRNSKLRILEYYGKQVKEEKVILNFNFPHYSKSKIQNDESEEKLQTEIAYIIEQVISKGEIKGSASKISSDLNLSKYGRNPITLTKFLKSNEELLNANFITISTGKGHNGRLVTLTFDDKKMENQRDA